MQPLTAFIKYNPSNRQEKILYKLCTDKIAKNGKKYHFFIKKLIFKLIKKWQNKKFLFIL